MCAFLHWPIDQMHEDLKTGKMTFLQTYCAANWVCDDRSQVIASFKEGEVGNKMKGSTEESCNNSNVYIKGDDVI